MSRNVNRDFQAHAPARAAAALWGHQYAASGLGLMGFWDALDKGQRAIARTVADDIRRARAERDDEKN